MERIDGPTPNGGAYAIVYYFDAQGREVPKRLACKIEIQEYNEYGGRIQTTYGGFDPSLLPPAEEPEGP